ncbi:hypothetical protein DSO57_1030685 [Entomophthora muscae]|uniref:Uncharacterized protein n=1 Tax=Entomophthora muscae TaxID=34485 RepID=A0ACC2RRZ7_9FUNG|nr:hypothetical protein DSO57_1030685 [Entomophthora muscae]
MTPPLTLQPNYPQESVATNESTYTQIFVWRIQVQPVHPAIVLPLTLIAITFL